MRLALAEMRRSRGRFVAITAAVALIAFLVLVLSALADGLYFGASGAIRTGHADLYVFSRYARKDLTRSTLPESDGATLARVAGVAQVGELGSLQGTGTAAKKLLDIALFGFTPGGPGGPQRAAAGRLPRPDETGVAAADGTLKAKGLRIGDHITMSGTSVPITIVGFTSDSRYELQPTLWTTISTWQVVRSQARPELAGEERVVQAFAVRLAPGAPAGPTAASIDAALGGSTQTITAGAAVLALPGLKQQRSTFNQIVYTTFAVAAIVIALFFALVTLEKRTQLAVLKALGASARDLATGIVAQAIVVSAAGVVFGIALSRLVALVIPASIPVTFRAATAADVAGAVLVTGVLGAAVSFRRVTRIDPASALGGD